MKTSNSRSKYIFDDVVACRERNKYWNMQQIADEIGCTRERVRQILKKAGVRTTSLLYGSSTICSKCGGRKAGSFARMCKKCRMKNVRRISFPCMYCDKTITMLNTAYLRKIKYGQKMFFCSKRCQGKWLGYNHAPYKYSDEFIRKMLNLYRIMTAKEVADKLNMSANSVKSLASRVGFRKINRPNKIHDHNMIIELYKTKTAKEVAKELGITEKAVTNIAYINKFHKTRIHSVRRSIDGISQSGRHD